MSEQLRVTLNMIPAVHRFVRVGDHGYREQQRQFDEEAERAAARRRLALPTDVQGLLAEYGLLSNIRAQNRK